MATPQIKLLNTVKALHEQGKVDLTASDKEQIERETRELLKNSQKKRAMKAPEGFEEVVEKLHGVDADVAFKLVTDFLADKGLLEVHDKAEEKADEVSDKIEDVLDKEEKGLDEDKGGFDKEIPLDMEPVKDEPKEEILVDKKEDLPKEDKKEDVKDIPKGFGKDKKDDLKKDLVEDLSEDTGKLREKVLAQAMELSSEEKKKRMLEMQDEDKKSEDMPSMGMEAGTKVVVTANKNILVVQAGKPVFHAVVKEEIKSDPSKLARLANRVSGWLVSEGVKKTASKCGAKLINAGIDDDINFGGQELPSADKGIADEGLTNSDPSPEGEVAKSSQEGASFDNGAHVARYEKVSGDAITDGAIDEIQEERPLREVEVTEKAVDEIKEERPEPEEATQDEALFNIKNLEAQYRTLYASRAKKAAERAQESFMEKFSKCLAIASQRMLKNLTYNPYKSASADVLMSTNIQFSNGDRYAGMDEAAAVELTELVASEGHERFIESLVKNALDLMAREDTYLSDVEADLQNLAPVPVEVTASRKASNESLREEAIEGSVAIQARRASTALHGNLVDDGIRRALSGTKTGRRLSDF